MALVSLNDLYDVLSQNTSFVQEELAAVLKTDEKYKYKDLDSIKSEIEKQVYSILLKLQHYSDVSTVQKLCVKFFLVRGKILLALKSLLLLENKYPNSFERLEALHRFTNYVKNNKDKINPDYLELIHNKAHLKDSEKVLQEARNKLMTEEKNPAVLLEYKLRINKLFGENTTFNNLVLNFSTASKLELRNTKHNVK